MGKTKRTRPWTADTDVEFIRDWNGGIPLWRLSQIYEVSTTTLREKRLILGLRPRRSDMVGRRKRYRQNKIPKTGSQVIKALRRLMNQEEVSVEEASKRSGIDKSSISSWGRIDPKLSNLEAVGNSIGFELVWRRKIPRKRGGKEL